MLCDVWWWCPIFFFKKNNYIVLVFVCGKLKFKHIIFFWQQKDSAAATLCVRTKYQSLAAAMAWLYSSAFFCSKFKSIAPMKALWWWWWWWWWWLPRILADSTSFFNSSMSRLSLARRFWNQVMTCALVNPRVRAIWNNNNNNLELISFFFRNLIWKKRKVINYLITIGRW